MAHDVKQLRAPGATTGYVLKVQADKTIAPEAEASGGGGGVATKSALTEDDIAVAQVVLRNGVKAQADTAANAEAVGIVESISSSPALGVSGYTSGGQDLSNLIDKFPFASDANATDVGDLTVARQYVTGQSSATNGYTSGGDAGGDTNIIDKFPFATDANATDVGDLTVARSFGAGQSSATSGYTSGGEIGTSDTNIIDKFPFASDANATDVGDLTVARQAVAGQSSFTHGYSSGGLTGTQVNIIDKFLFASDGNATDVGDLTVVRRAPAGQSSATNGYTSGGTDGSPTNIIDKFPFASNASATDVGDLTASRWATTGQSSGTDGYTSGGFTGSSSNVIDKFPFASDANAADVGDLIAARQWLAGQQELQAGSVSGVTVTNGEITLASGIWPDSADDGDVLYLSEVTAGLLTLTPPTNPGEVNKPMVVCTSVAEGFVINLRGQIISADDNSSLVSNITKVGIAVGQPVLADGTAAQADNADNAEAIGITQSIDEDTGAVVTGGEITLASGTWPDGATLGDVLYVDPDNAGALVKVAPTTNGNIDKPMVVCQSTTTGIVVNMRGVVVTTLSLAQAPLFHIRHEEADTVDGGTATAATWVTRKLNAVKTDGIAGASVAANVITLPAGSYEVDAWGMGHRNGNHQIRLRDTGASSDLAVGSTELSNTSDFTATSSRLSVRFTLSSSTTIELQHHSSATKTTDGFGASFTSNSKVEVYAEVKIRKIG